MKELKIVIGSLQVWLSSLLLHLTRAEKRQTSQVNAGRQVVARLFFSITRSVMHLSV